MTHTPSAIPWGTTTLLLDHPEFREGFTTGRWYYFAFFLKDQPGERTPTLRSEEILRTMGVRDEETGTYRLDYEGEAHPAQLLGMLAGFLSGPLLPETEEERNQRSSSRGSGEPLKG